MKIIKIYRRPIKNILIFSAVCLFIIAALSMSPNSNTIPDKGNTVNKKFPSQPNIIIFLADDFGYEIPAYTGGQSYLTPNLDFMAANGIQFTNAYSHPDGFPSRLALQTGKYNIRNYTLWGTLPAGEKTIGNMLHDAGYATCFVGKWNMDGGDSNIHRAGYDNYSVFMPYANNDNDAEFRHQYISPNIYQNGNFLPASQTAGKYSEDLYFKYVTDFIDNNGSQPFFIFYAMNLPRSPFAPTPDDPEYVGFNPDTAVVDNKKYFPGMVAYLDKTIGKMLTKLEANGIAQNTVILFCADNATTKVITSLYNGKVTRGGKNLTSQPGTRTPLEVYWPGTVAPAQISNTLIDYTDFLPTLADIAGVPVPANNGVLDGISFYDNLVGTAGVDRSSVYCYWDNSPNDTLKPIRYINDANYKLYKDTSGVKNFYRLSTDINEKHSVPDSSLKPNEIIIKQNFETQIDGIHK